VAISLSVALPNAARISPSNPAGDGADQDDRRDADPGQDHRQGQGQVHQAEPRDEVMAMPVAASNTAGSTLRIAV
jgi:hypothetical protein